MMSNTAIVTLLLLLLSSGPCSSLIAAPQINYFDLESVIRHINIVPDTRGSFTRFNFESDYLNLDKQIPVIASATFILKNIMPRDNIPSEYETVLSLGNESLIWVGPIDVFAKYKGSPISYLRVFIALEQGPQARISKKITAKEWKNKTLLQIAEGKGRFKGYLYTAGYKIYKGQTVPEEVYFILEVSQNQ